MDEKPDNAEPLRWYQFSLRTLLIVVALVSVLCACAAHVTREAQIVRERTYLLSASCGVCPVPLRKSSNESEIPALRRWLGDQHILLIGIAESIADEKVDLYRSKFPEAKILLMGDDFAAAWGALARAGKADPPPSLP